jgi:hypothetical protein
MTDQMLIRLRTMRILRDLNSLNRDNPPSLGDPEGIRNFIAEYEKRWGQDDYTKQLRKELDTIESFSKENP